MALTDVTDGSRIIHQGDGICKVTLSGTVKVGDPIGNSSGTWVRADANATIYAELVAGQDGVSTDVIVAYKSARIGGVSGGTLGGQVYLSDTAGGYSETAGTVEQVVGFMESTTVMVIAPSYYGMPNYVLNGWFMNDTLTMGDGKNISLGTGTGTTFGTSTAQKFSFWGGTPAARGTAMAYTQTYSTADRTHANLTSATLADSSTGTASATTIAAVTAGTAAPTAAVVDNIASLTAQCNALRVDLTDLKQVVNGIIDDLQTLNLFA